jgi:S-(hydroxymethyl)glutathione dehydrogenase/alcohol dehydrogenase
LVLPSLAARLYCEARAPTRVAKEIDMKAAVMRASRTPLSIEDVQLASPGPREVLVRTHACGVCHSDLHVLEGSIPVPPPCVLGHEPAGVVEAVGKEVAYVQPGDHVIACLSVFCGTCKYCLSGRTNLCGGMATMRKPGEPPRISKNGEAIAQFAISRASPSRCSCTRTRS